MAQRKRSSKARASKTAHFIVTNEKHPAVRVKPGMKLDVQSVRLMDPTLRPAKTLAARLCGGTSTCLALVDIGQALGRDRPT
jgi:hypothetical protein